MSDHPLSTEKIRSFLRRKAADAFLVDSIKNVRYLTGFTGSSAFVLLTRERGLFFTDFRYQEQATRLKVRNTLRLGRASLAVGLLFLAACVAGAQLIFTHDNVLSDLLHEGLLIVGWVAMWRPLEILLYDWWPLLRDARMYARIAQMPVELRQRR